MYDSVCCEGFERNDTLTTHHFQDLVLANSQEVTNRWIYLFTKGTIVNLAVKNVRYTLSSGGGAPTHCFRTWLGPISRNRCNRLESVALHGVTANLNNTAREYLKNLKALQCAITIERTCPANAAERLLQSAEHNFMLGKFQNDEERNAILNKKDPLDIRFEGIGPRETPLMADQLAKLRGWTVCNNNEALLAQYVQDKNAEIACRKALGVTYIREYDILSVPVPAPAAP